MSDTNSVNVQKECANMVDKQVYKVVKRSEVPTDKKIVGTYCSSYQEG